MAEAPKVAVKKYKVKVASASGSPQSKQRTSGAPPATGAAAAAFAAQQQRQQAALLRQQQAYAQQRYANLTPQQRAQVQYQQQMRQLELAQAAVQAGNATPQQHQLLRMYQQQQAQLRAQQAAAAAASGGGAQSVSAQQRAHYQQQQAAQLRAQQAAASQAKLQKTNTPPLPTVPGDITPPSLPKKPPVIPSKPDSKPPAPTKRDSVSSPEGLGAPPRPPQGKEIELFWPTDKTPFEQPDSDSNIVYDKSEDGKTKIKAASIEKLVEKATSYNADSALQKTLLLTYRSIVTPAELLDLLMQRFSMPLPEGNEASIEAFKSKKQKPIQVRVCQLLKTWISNYFHDFDNTELQNKLYHFCSDIIKPVCPPGATLEALVQRQINGEGDKDHNISLNEPPPEPILPVMRQPSFLDIHPIEIARQLTIIEANLYRSIKPHECIGLAWSKKNAKERAPNILKMIDRFNIVSNWVVSEIVRQETQKERIQTLNHFIEIAERCRGLNNFNGCMEIISGLGDSSVHRLKCHWAELPAKSKAYYDDLKLTLSSEQNYKNFRACLKSVSGACIPYLGMYLTDLTFIEDGNNEKIGELYNFAKRIFVSNVIQEIQQYQQYPYNLQTVPGIQSYFNSLAEKTIDKEACYQRSLQILPRGGKGAAQPQTQSKSGDGDGYGDMEHFPDYPFNDKDSPKNITLQDSPNDPTGVKVIAGTLEKIVERCTYKTFPGVQFVSAFLLTYRTYTTGKNLMDLLIMRFNMPLPKDSEQMDRFKKEQLLPVQLRVINVIKMWVENYPLDFTEDKELSNTFLQFVNTNTSMHASSLKRIAKMLKQKIGTNANNRRGTISTSTETPKMLPLQPDADPNNLRFLDFQPEEIARQLCISDGNLLSSVTPLEMLNNTWEFEPAKAINIVELVGRIDRLKNWVIRQIIDIEASERRKMLTQLIHVTSACYELHNFNAVVGLYQGLQDSSITSLTQTWDGLDGTTKSKFNSIKSIAGNLTSMKVFREHVLEKCRDEPGIYPVQAYLEEISTIEDNEQDYVSGQLINMNKNRKLYVSIEEFMGGCNSPYSFEVSAWVQNYLKKLFDGTGQIPLSSQLSSMGKDKAKEMIKSGMLSDEIKSELVKSLKKILLADMSGSLQIFTDKIESHKKQLRDDLQAVHQKFSRDSFPDHLAEEPLNQRFGADVDSLEDWTFTDQDGSVFGWPEQVTIPTILTSDGETYLVYQKKIFDTTELSVALRIQAFYAQCSGCETLPRVVALSNFIAPNTRLTAQEHNVELICVPA